MSARIFNRHLVWIAGAVLTATVAGLLVILPRVNEGTYLEPVCSQITYVEPIVEPELLTTKFELTVFHRGKGKRHWSLDRVHKWEQEVHVHLIRMQREYRSVIEKMLRDYSCVTGLRTFIHQKENKIQPRIAVRMHASKDIAAFARQENIDVQSLKDFSCYTLPDLYSDVRVRVFNIGFSENLSEVEMRRCMLRMMAHSLGLFTDSDAIITSIFNPNGPSSDRLPINDKIILRALYDSRIKNGMKREEAMDLARQIIPELVKAMRERGVEALYQR